MRPLRHVVPLAVCAVSFAHAAEPGAGATVSAPAAAPAAAPAPAPAPAPSFTAEELDAAIARTSEQLRRAGSESLRAPLALRLGDLWVLRARQHAKAGQSDRALDAYDQALQAVPAHPIALVEAGWIQLEAGKPDVARGLAETALAHDGDNAFARELRGEILYRDNRLEDALDDFRTALLKHPGSASLARRIEKLEKELTSERDYRRADSSHFVLRFDGDRDESVRHILLDTLERQLDDLQREFSVSPLPPLTVILYTSRQFHETTGTGDEVVGLFDGKVRLPVGGVTRVTPGLERVVRHELTHALLHARGRGTVPKWLHEGLAQVMEPRDLARYRTGVLREAKPGDTLDLEPFSYPKAFTYVAYLEAQYSRARLLWFVDLLAAGNSEADAFAQAFGASRDETLEGWRRWLAQR